jgi:hypothetical protein
MKRLTVVGGKFDNNGGKSSSVVNKIFSEFVNNYKRFENLELINGGDFIDFCDDDFNTQRSDLVLWFADFDNSFAKNYPKKKTGSVLIISKLMHEGVTRGDAVGRIFKTGANAVLCIFPRKSISDPEKTVFDFELIDALNNTWFEGYSIEELCKAIYRLYDWASDALIQNVIMLIADCKNSR